MKTITICDKEYEIDCNALTYAKFRKFFNKSIFDDINILNNFLNNQVVIAKQLKEENPDIDEETIIASLSRLMQKDMDLFVLAATRIAYIMILTANEKIEEYEQWLKNITHVKTNDKWIAEVTEFAVDCFC